MSVNIEMPKLSDTMTEGTLIKWHKQVGDSVEIGDILAEVETDKATMEMEAFDEGTITEILVQEGDKATIGGILAILDGDEGASSPEKSEDSAPAEKAASEASSADAEEEKDTDSKPEATKSSAPTTSSDGGRVKSSPLARKVAEEMGVDLSNVSGTGPGGRIVKADVEGASSGKSSEKSSQAAAAAGLSAAAKSRSSSPAPSAPSAPAPAASAIQPVAKEGDERIELLLHAQDHRITPSYFQDHHPALLPPCGSRCRPAHVPAQAGQRPSGKNSRKQIFSQRFHPESCNQRGRNRSCDQCVLCR